MAQAGIEARGHDGPHGADGLRLSGLLAPERVQIPLRGRGKEPLLSELVDLVARRAGSKADHGAMYAAIWEREKVLSTGIGGGIALPHAKFDGLDQVVMAAGVSDEPVDFDALDGKPVQLFFLTLGPGAEAGTQVRVLSRIGRLMRDESLRNQLVSAENAEQFLHRLGAAERSV